MPAARRPPPAPAPAARACPAAVTTAPLGPATGIKGGLFVPIGLSNQD